MNTTATPFWNKTIKEVSSRIWLPLETTSMCSPFNCSHGSFDNVKSKAWFTVQKWKPAIYQAPLPCLPCLPGNQNNQNNQSKQTIQVNHTHLFKLNPPFKKEFVTHKYKTNWAVNVRKQKYEWVALDPGSTTFQTLYSPTPDVAYKFGHNDNLVLLQINKRIEELDDVIHPTNLTKIEKLALKYQLNTLVNTTHEYVARFLCKHFNNIIIPPFVVENLWRHAEFLALLLCEADKYNVNVYVRGEEYTTKTCTHCGRFNDIGNKKMIECKHCFIKIDRDLSGSRNIFLRNCDCINI